MQNIKRTQYYTGPWRRDPVEPTFMGLTAFQFDMAVLVTIIGAALAVWLFVFGGAATSRDFIGREAPSGSAASAPVAPATTELAPEAASAPPAEAAPPVVAAPVISPEQELLMESARALANDVQSFRGRFQMNVSLDGQRVNSGGDMVFQAPDKMHMTMNISGQTFEMLALLPNMYMRVPGQGWYVLNGQALGFSPDVLNEYMNNRGLFDYEAQAAVLAGVVQVPDEEIDGVSYLHLQGTLDFQTLLAALPPGAIDTSAPGVSTMSGPVQMDVLLDKTTHLPRRQTVSMDLDVNGSQMSMDMRMAITEYNGEVTIPDAPDDARPLESLRAPADPPQID